MIVVRSVLHGKMGSGGELAAATVKGMKAMQAAGVVTPAKSWRVLTDRSGKFDTVTLEVVVESIGSWEASRDALFSSKEFGEQMQSTYGLVESGHTDYLFIEGEG